MITLDCRPSSSCDWELKFPFEGKFFLRFDLGLEGSRVPLEDPIHFESLKMGLKKFTEELWPIHEERIKGAILYMGSADFTKSFLWTETQKDNFEKWGGGDAHQKRLFAADSFIHYFQMLSFSLPDELPIYLWIDANIEGTLAERHQLLSKERFEHFRVAIKDLPFTSELLWDGKEGVKSPQSSKRGLCFPIHEKCTKQTLEKIDTLMGQIQPPFRVIFEPFLNEDWEGIDDLYILKDAVSPSGKRKILGFEATGGNVSG